MLVKANICQHFGSKKVGIGRLQVIDRAKVQRQSLTHGQDKHSDRLTQKQKTSGNLMLMRKKEQKRIENLSLFA
jgi:hypothetical protein